MMTLPKLPSTSSQIPEANRFRKTASTDWLLQDAKTKFSQSSMSPSSSGASMDNSYPKMSTQSSSSNFSEVCQTNFIHHIYFSIVRFYQRNIFHQRRIHINGQSMLTTDTLNV